MKISIPTVSSREVIKDDDDDDEVVEEAAADDVAIVEFLLYSGFLTCVRIALMARHQSNKQARKLKKPQ